MHLEIIKKTFDENPECRIVLFIRHAEKNNDGSSSLTHKGIEDSLTLAEKLRELNINIKIYSSPESRCEQTANIINSRLANSSAQVYFSNALGKPGLQILDNNLYEQLYAEFKCREIFHQWKNKQHYDVLINPIQLKEMANIFFQTTCIEKGITLYISQSGSVASIGYGLGLLNYDVINGEWVDFLDGFILSISEVD